MAERGFDLLLVARDVERLTALADELSLHHGISATAYQADLSRDEPMRGLAEKLAKEERLMLLVNNADFGTKGKLATRPVSEQATMLELHVMAPMLLTRAVVPKMIEQREGFVITVASVASFTARRLLRSISNSLAIIARPISAFSFVNSVRVSENTPDRMLNHF